MTGIPGPQAPPPPTGWVPGGAGGRDPYAGIAEFGTEPRADAAQHFACWRCVLRGDEPSVPQVVVMMDGYSYCVACARNGASFQLRDAAGLE